MTDTLMSKFGTREAGPSRRWAALAVLCVSMLIVWLDNTVLNVALPTLVRDLQWIVDAYVLVFAGLPRGWRDSFPHMRLNSGTSCRRAPYAK